MTNVFYAGTIAVRDLQVGHVVDLDGVGLIQIAALEWFPESVDVHFIRPDLSNRALAAAVAWLAKSADVEIVHPEATPVRNRMGVWSGWLDDEDVPRYRIKEAVTS